MAVTFTTDGVLLSVVLHGAHTFQELVAAMQEAISSPRFIAGSLVLLDERESQDNPSASEKRTRVSWISSLRPRIGTQIALVTSPNPLRYGLSRMASIYFDIEGFDAAVFTDVATAKRWLASHRPTEPPFDRCIQVPA